MIARGVILLAAIVLAFGLMMLGAGRAAAKPRRENIAAILRAAHVAQFKAPPDAGTLRMAVAHVRLEGLKLPGYNLGGISHAGKGRWVRRGSQRLALFSSRQRAARAYWKHLAKRCPGALATFGTGEPLKVARALKGCGYYEALSAVYGERLSNVWEGVK